MKEFVCSGDGCTVRPECRVRMDGTPGCCLLDGKPVEWFAVAEDPQVRTVRCEHAGSPDHRVCDAECELKHRETVGFTMAIYCPFMKGTRVEFLPVEGGR